MKLLVGLIGAGIQRSLAPALHEEEARHHGLRLHYQLIDLDAAGAGAEALAGLLGAARIMGFAALNITYPCKQAVMPLLDALSEEARTIGAVNTVVREASRLVGHNTDGSGWSWGFRRALPDADLSCVVLLGAGGAGSACADAVLRLARDGRITYANPASALVRQAIGVEVGGSIVNVGVLSGMVVGKVTTIVVTGPEAPGSSNSDRTLENTLPMTGPTSTKATIPVKAVTNRVNKPCSKHPLSRINTSRHCG